MFYFMPSLYRFIQVLFLSFLCTECFASVHKEAQYTIAYDDSLQLGPEEMVLYSTVMVVNTGKDKLELNGELSLPTGWKSLSGNELALMIAPGDTQYISINLLRSKGVTALWQEVKISL